MLHEVNLTLNTIKTIIGQGGNVKFVGTEHFHPLTIRHFRASQITFDMGHLLRFALIITTIYGPLTLRGAPHGAVVADSHYRMPLPGAMVFGRDGRRIATSGTDGRLPQIAPGEYPLTIRYTGFKERRVDTAVRDTIFLQETLTELPEVMVRSRHQNMLHMLAYVREYSSLSTYTDTVFLFREKMVDYMMPAGGNVRFKGWKSPRTLASKSYYRFTDAHGKDSVSDRCNNHFSWADWVGAVIPGEIPASLRLTENGSDTVRGRYSPTEIWTRRGHRMQIDVNVMADTASRKWVPNLSAFFRRHIDFEQFRLQLDFSGIAGDTIAPVDLNGYSFCIESNGRGRGMFMFNRVDEPFFVSTYAEVYVIDKEYVTVAEARKWEKRLPAPGEISIYEPAQAPPIQPAILHLVERVNALDHDQIRLDLDPDKRMIRPAVVKLNVGQKVLQRIKGMFGLDKVNAERKWKRQWRQFTRERAGHRKPDDTDRQHPD